ncbi:hypothetical protein AgCh_012703 [Apium graveolens]
MLRYYNKEHPSFFATLPREDRNLHEMKLPDNFINGLEESIPSKAILVLANGHETYPIPGHFWRAFGKLLPPKVQFYMRNGSRYAGTCSKTEKKMYGFQDLVQGNGLSETEKVLFTYFGEGKLFIMIFDKSNVEAMLLDEDSSSSESDMEIVQEPILIPANLEVDVHNNDNMTFTHVMTTSNVDNTCHGAYSMWYISVCKDRQNPIPNTLIFPGNPQDTERIEYKVTG